MLFDHLHLLNSLLVSRQEIIVRLTSVGDVGTNGIATDNNAQHLGN